MTSINQKKGIFSKTYYLISITFVSLVMQSCSETSPAASGVQFLVTNKSADKVSRLTILVESGDSLPRMAFDSAYLTNIPENLAVRLTYDISKNVAEKGMYRLVATGSGKRWNQSFGKFNGKTDEDPDHSYNLEIRGDSVMVIP